MICYEDHVKLQESRCEACASFMGQGPGRLCSIMSIRLIVDTRSAEVACYVPLVSYAG